jgi:hypothetical protein
MHGRGAGCLVLSLLATVLGSATADAASAPCPAGTESKVTLDARDTNGSTLVATHPIEVSPEFSSTDVEGATVRISVPAGVKLTRGSGADSVTTIRSAKPGAVPVTITWVEEHFGDSRTTRCSGAATITLRLSAPTRPKIEVPSKNFQQLIEYAITVVTEGKADLSPVTVRFRARRGPARPPSGRTRFSVATWDPLSQRGTGNGVRLSTSGSLQTKLETFGREARISAGPFTRYGFNTRRGVFPKGGFEIELRQSGRRLVRVRGSMDICESHSGCRVNTRVTRG